MVDWIHAKIEPVPGTIYEMKGDGTLEPAWGVTSPPAGERMWTWWNPDVAAQWLARAVRLERNETTTDTRASFNVFAIFSAIMEYYNALNVPWYMHSPARNLYRKYMSGPPAASYPGGPVLDALFSPDKNYAPFSAINPSNYHHGWYRPDIPGPEPLPISTDFQGLIPRETRALFLRYYPHGPRSPSAINPVAERHPTRFLPMIDLDLVEDPLTTRNRFPRAEYRPSVRNVAVNRWPEANALDVCVNLQTGEACADRMFATDRFYFEVTHEVAGTEVVGMERDPLPASGPMQAYLPWAREWLQALQQTTPAAVVTNVRSYVRYVNEQQNSPAYGSQLVALAARVDANVVSQQAANDPGLTTAATVAGSIGLALTPVPVVGPVLAMVAGAVSLIIRLIDVTNQQGVIGVYKDDLGRYKPTLERAWLSGRPELENPTGRPNFALPVPPPLPPSRPPVSLVGGLPVLLPGIGSGADATPPAPPGLPGGSIGGKFNAEYWASMAAINRGAGIQVVNPAQPSALRRAITSTPGKAAIGAGVLYGLWKLFL